MNSKWMVMAIAAMMAGSSFAAEGAGVTPNLDKGTKVLEGSGYFDNDNPLGDEFDLNLGYGYFIADGLEVAVLGGYLDNDVYKTYRAGGRIEYNLVLDSAWVPFAGVGVLWAGAEAEEDSDVNNDTAVGFASLGVKWFLRNDVALTLSGVYEKAADDIYVDEDLEAQDDNTAVRFGIRYYFD